MKSRYLGILMCALIGIAPVYAQKSGEKQEKPAQQHEQVKSQQSAKPQHNMDQQRPQSHPRSQPSQMSKPSAQRVEQRDQQPKQQHAPKQAQQPKQEQRPKEQRSDWQAHKSGNWAGEHKTWAARGGYNGYHIPDDRFRTSFGREHSFRIGSYPYRLVNGFPSFQYNGFWFVLADPYPGDWGDNWYDTDDCYIVYEGGGYYLYDSRHAGVAIAINVSM